MSTWADEAEQESALAVDVCERGDIHRLRGSHPQVAKAKFTNPHVPEPESPIPAVIARRYGNRLEVSRCAQHGAGKGLYGSSLGGGIWPFETHGRARAGRGQPWCVLGFGTVANPHLSAYFAVPRHLPQRRGTARQRWRQLQARPALPAERHDLRSGRGPQLPDRRDRLLVRP